MTRPASELAMIETIDNSSSTRMGDLWLWRLSNHVSRLHMLSPHQEHEYNTIPYTVGAKEIFTPYKSREHIYKSNV